MNNIFYLSEHTACFTLRLIPGEEADLLFPNSTGTTTAQYANSVRGATARTPRHPSGLPIWKPPYSTIVAYDMDTGEKKFTVPTGETPQRYQDAFARAGVSESVYGNTGTGALVPMVVTPTMLVYSDQALRRDPYAVGFGQRHWRDCGRDGSARPLKLWHEQLGARRASVHHATDKLQVDAFALPAAQAESGAH